MKDPTNGGRLAILQWYCVPFVALLDAQRKNVSFLVGSCLLSRNKSSRLQPEMKPRDTAGYIYELTVVAYKVQSAAAFFILPSMVLVFECSFFSLLPRRPGGEAQYNKPIQHVQVWRSGINVVDVNNADVCFSFILCYSQLELAIDKYYDSKRRRNN